tara:strand:- start:8972 stop:9217 length:246 start_codon:yes stop_codon:yes gene_type:complete
MTLEQIKTAVKLGKTVHWSNDSYIVTKGLLVKCLTNDHCVGLTHLDGVNWEYGNGDKFYLKDDNDLSIVPDYIERGLSGID